MRQLLKDQLHFGNSAGSGKGGLVAADFVMHFRPEEPGAIGLLQP